MGRLAMRLDLDSPVNCADGTFGELADVIIDPRTRRLTHLVVQPPDKHERARLVPIGRAHLDATSNEVVFDSTVAEICEIPPLQESEYLPLGQRPAENPGWDIGIEYDFELPPYQSLGVNALGAGMEPIDDDPHVTLTYDRIPKGMVEIRRESDVISSDGKHVGHVVGFVVGDREQIEQLLVEHGHLWTKREIAIPARSIDRIECDEVVLAVASDQM